MLNKVVLQEGTSWIRSWIWSNCIRDTKTQSIAVLIQWKFSTMNKPISVTRQGRIHLIEIKNSRNNNLEKGDNTLIVISCFPHTDVWISHNLDVCILSPQIRTTSPQGNYIPRLHCQRNTQLAVPNRINNMKNNM